MSKANVGGRGWGIAVALFVLRMISSVSARAENPGVVAVGDLRAFSQVVAISDVHGEFDHVRTLLRNAGVLDASDHWAAGRTLMVVTGDSIDKGPQAIEVLRLWMRLQTEAEAQHGRLIVLLGNHEAEFLADPSNAKAAETRKDAATYHLALADLTDTAKPLGAFLHGLPLAATVGKWVFCHAGWVPDEPWATFTAQARATLNAGKYGDPLLLDDNSILEKKTSETGKKWWRSKKEIAELERRLDADGFAGVVFGHRPTGLDIVDNVGELADGRMFKIDSGMAPVEEDASASADSAANGQPYAGHLLLFPHPAELEVAKFTGIPGGRVEAFSINAAGHREAVPLATR